MGLGHIVIVVVRKLSVAVYFPVELIPLYNVVKYDCGYCMVFPCGCDHDCRLQCRPHFILACCSLRVMVVSYAV
jgi:hypothetical protein